MNITHESVRVTIDSVFIKGSYFYNEYLVEQLKSEKAFQILSEIIDKSGKTITEAIFVLLAAIRYHFRDVQILTKIEAEKSFQLIIHNYYEELVKISVPGKVQGNTPERALSIIDVLYRKMPLEDIVVIELGASFGLIGSCLLNPAILIDNGTKYLVEGQKLPEGIKRVNSYLGIDINPPDKEWLLSCFSKVEDAIRIHEYIHETPSDPNFKLIKSSAVGFSNLEEVKKIDQKKKIVIITSFMLYQFDNELKKQLISEIVNFCSRVNGNWIAQEVDISDFSHPVYYIDFDGQRIITLQDDKCSDWKWIK